MEHEQPLTPAGGENGLGPEPDPAGPLLAVSPPGEPEPSPMAEPEPPPRPMEPVPAGERIAAVDTLRGAALLGILTANMRGFHAPGAAYFNTDAFWTWTPDRIAQLLVNIFVQGKFITIFAVLFGVGFAIQMDRAAERGQKAGFYRRRLLWLLVFGIIHSFAIWWGDILITYALGGFFLLLFRKTKPSRLKKWAWGLYLFLVVPMLAGLIAHLAGADMPKPPEIGSRIAESMRAYGQGSLRDIFRIRAREWASLNGMLPLFLTQVAGLFCFGLYLWRRGYVRDAGAHRAWWKKAQRVGLLAGLVCTVASNALLWVFHPRMMEMTPPAVAAMLLGFIGTPGLSMFYASAVVLACQNPVWRERLKPFSYVGRMALTNYLLQSLVCTTLFYSYGGGLYGKVGIIQGLGLTVVIYGLQVPFSQWWLARHRYGPMEWLWRRLTYGRTAGVTS